MLLTRKAKKMRKETGDERYTSSLERSQAKVSRKQLMFDLLASPFIMLIQEPMVSIMCKGAGSMLIFLGSYWQSQCT